ncbi:uncharacterized protein LOC113522332 [Galleria mellonella]|uniref:Uncharacterized protein LOC113522332 n=1 Tax=Galleria mellonella TaxID=7137 RepID=A0A6J1X305_GALME|nr:uncharacterized protein LOC113522332 [Galleria mellonella]
MSMGNNLLFMELFIDNVKKHPCLWDMNNISFKDPTRKDLTWELVAQECEMANGQEAKSQWKRLRDCHREALRIRNTTTGQATRMFSPWKYEQLMDFLLPQLGMKETTTNFSEDPILDNDGQFEISLPCPTVTDSCKCRGIENMMEEREKRREQRQIERDGFRKQIVEANRFPIDAVSELFSSLCRKTRELPISLQLRVQREVFESVSRAEEDALSLRQPENLIYTPNSSPSSYECMNSNASSSMVLQQAEEKVDEELSIQSAI